MTNNDEQRQREREALERAYEESNRQAAAQGSTMRRDETGRWYDTGKAEQVGTAQIPEEVKREQLARIEETKGGPGPAPARPPEGPTQEQAQQFQQETIQKAQEVLKSRGVLENGQINVSEAVRQRLDNYLIPLGVDVNKIKSTRAAQERQREQEALRKAEVEYDIKAAEKAAKEATEIKATSEKETAKELSPIQAMMREDIARQMATQSHAAPKPVSPKTGKERITEMWTMLTDLAGKFGTKEKTKESIRSIRPAATEAVTSFIKDVKDKPSEFLTEASLMMIPGLRTGIEWNDMSQSEKYFSMATDTAIIGSIALSILATAPFEGVGRGSRSVKSLERLAKEADDLKIEPGKIGVKDAKKIDQLVSGANKALKSGDANAILKASDDIKNLPKETKISPQVADDVANKIKQSAVDTLKRQDEVYTEWLKKNTRSPKRSVVEQLQETNKKQLKTLVEEKSKTIIQEFKVFEEGKYLPSRVQKTIEKILAKPLTGTGAVPGIKIKPGGKFIITPTPTKKTDEELTQPRPIEKSAPSTKRKVFETAAPSEEQKEWEREFAKAMPAQRDKMLEDAGIQITDALSPYIKTGTTPREILKGSTIPVPTQQTTPATQTLPETNTLTSPQTQTQPATETITQVLPQVETSTQTQTKPETKPITETPVQINLRTRTMTRTTSSKMPEYTIEGTSSTKKDWTPKDIKSAIAWKDGIVIHAIKAPYRRGIDEASFSVKNPPPGLKLLTAFKGPGSSTRGSIARGDAPNRLSVDVGNQDVIISRRGNRLKLSYNLDRGGRTRSQNTIARGRSKRRGRGSRIFY